MIKARLILGLADRFGCRPSEVLQEPVTVLRMVNVLELARGGAWGGE